MNIPQRALEGHFRLQHHPSTHLPRWAMKAWIPLAPGELWESSILVQLTDLTSRTSNRPFFLSFSFHASSETLVSPQAWQMLCYTKPTVSVHPYCSFLRCFGISAAIRRVLTLGHLHMRGCGCTCGFSRPTPALPCLRQSPLWWLEALLGTLPPM